MVTSYYLYRLYLCVYLQLVYWQPRQTDKHWSSAVCSSTLQMIPSHHYIILLLLPDNISDALPQRFHLVRNTMFLTQCTDLRGHLVVVVARHCGKQTSETENTRKQPSDINVLHRCKCTWYVSEHEQRIFFLFSVLREENDATLFSELWFSSSPSFFSTYGLSRTFFFSVRS